MPIYEYQCKNCGHHLEVLQKMTEPALEKCPHCGQYTLAKQISKSAFQLKGDGWYVTDFRDKNKPEKKSETPSTDNKETKAESKTVEKASTAPTTPTKE